MTEQENIALAEKNTKAAEVLAKREEEVRAREMDCAKREAALSDRNPAHVASEVETRDVGKELLQKRAVTLSSTGSVNTDSQLVKLVKNQRKVLGRCKFYYGRDMSTVIPVMAAAPSDPAVQTEGSTGITFTQGMALTAKTLTPQNDFALLPVTDYALKFSKVSEADLLAVFAEGFGDKWDGLISGATNGGVCEGLFQGGAVASANRTKTSATGFATLQEMYAFAGKVKKKNGNFAIYTTTEQVSALMAEATNDYSFIKKEIAEKGTIRGIEIVETVFTGTGSTGEFLAVASDLGRNYAIGLAQDVEIKGFEAADSNVVTYKGTAYIKGDIISDKNNFALVSK